MKRGPRKTLTYKTCSRAPGYRDLVLVLVDAGGAEYELRLPPQDVQQVIFDCAGAAKQINDHPPLDWKQWSATILWPQVTTWMPGPTAAKKSLEADQLQRITEYVAVARETAVKEAVATFYQLGRFRGNFR